VIRPYLLIVRALGSHGTGTGEIEQLSGLPLAVSVLRLELLLVDTESCSNELT
jgi:hypothetical protein